MYEYTEKNQERMNKAKHVDTVRTTCGRANVSSKNVPVHNSLNEQNNEIYGQFGILQCKSNRKKKQPIRFAPPVLEPGAQKNIQELAADMYKKIHGIQNEDMDSMPVWVTDIIANGLCGGWAALHRANPKRFVSIWTALAAWNKEDDLTEYMNRTCSMQEPAIGWENYIISLTNSAVRIMAKLEPDAGYQILSDDEAVELPEFALEQLSKKPIMLRHLDVKEKGAGALIYKTILSEAYLKHKAGAEYIIHIETDHHHMSVRTRFINSEVRIEEIVEPEYVGVVQNPNAFYAQQILEHGTYLPPTAEKIGTEKDWFPQAQTICLKYYRLN
ncbi:MAG: hypothetical protein NC300_04850 [Bacteroidales bacterium]|nr:hypothetical protein [Clostridium sp.]MCM1203450.1 hypothetical protein [Bacteroidales bacterium]